MDQLYFIVYYERTPVISAVPDICTQGGSVTVELSVADSED